MDRLLLSGANLLTTAASVELPSDSEGFGSGGLISYLCW